MRLFAGSFKSAHAVVRRLRRSQADLTFLMPLDAARMASLRDEEHVRLDAFIQRFQNAQDILDAQVLRGLLALEEVDLTGKTPRDVSNLLEKYGIIDSAARWRDLRDLRNTLAHEYPDEPDIQIDRLNGAYAAIDEVVSVLNRVQVRVTAKHLADLSAYQPL
ncbi:MAG TPA: hypothetical protein VD978_22380 [Azospirillum sp.]|nr:hypothetical protein [Azospirillum sp.]